MAVYDKAVVAFTLPPERCPRCGWEASIYRAAQRPEGAEGVVPWECINCTATWHPGTCVTRGEGIDCRCGLEPFTISPEPEPECRHGRRGHCSLCLLRGER